MEHKILWRLTHRFHSFRRPRHPHLKYTLRLNREHISVVVHDSLSPHWILSLLRQKSIKSVCPFSFPFSPQNKNKQDFKIKPESASQIFWLISEWNDTQEGERLEFGKVETKISPLLVWKGVISLSLEVLSRHW